MQNYDVCYLNYRFKCAGSKLTLFAAQPTIH
jgi:hypothetical protein